MGGGYKRGGGGGLREGRLGGGDPSGAIRGGGGGGGHGWTCIAMGDGRAAELQRECRRHSPLPENTEQGHCHRRTPLPSWDPNAGEEVTRRPWPSGTMLGPGRPFWGHDVGF